jgi:serine/threonine-protein kinase
MLYELLSGRAAFAGQNIPEVVYKVVHVDPEPITSYLPGLPAAKAAALHKAMSKSQDDRFASVADFVEAFTGTPLAPTRIRVTPAPADIAEDSAIASNKLAVGSAATMDSQKRSTPLPTDVSKLASAATIDSQKVAREQALAATIDSSKIERQSTLMAAQPAQPLGTQADAALVAAPRSVPLRTLVVGVGVIVCIAAALWVITSDSAKERASDTQALAAGTTDTAPVIDASVQVALVASSEDASMSSGGRGGQMGDSTEPLAQDRAVEADAAMPSKDVSRASPPDEQSKSVTPKHKRLKDTQEEEVAANDPKRDQAETLIARARKQLASGKNRDAEASADQALKSFWQPQSFEIKVMVSCNNSDLTNANAAMRNIPKKHRALRKKLQTYCKARKTNLDMKTSLDN